ncbi:gamma-butyrobetaine hydroxylase family protein [Roseibium sp. M-1]
MTEPTAPWPTELRVSKDKKSLTVAFDTGDRHELSAEYLRVCSPSAEVQGHNPSQKKTIPGKRNVQIMKVDPVGNYAVKIHFDDMHNSGIFSWTYLFELGSDRDSHWGTYLRELEEKGLSRDQ